MKAPVWGAALDDVCTDDTLLVVPTPAGRLFDQATAARWSTERHLVFACGRYEGIDQRVVDDAARRMRVAEVSIGDYVLNGGESATLVMVEAVVRLLPEVLGNPPHTPTTRTPRACSRGRVTRGRRVGAGWTYPPCCCPVITRRSRPGGTSRRSPGPGTGARTCWATTRSGRPGTTS